MSFRINELAHFSDSLDWLTPHEAAAKYHEALVYSDTTRYGLNASSVCDIERFNATHDKSIVDVWLAQHCNGKSVRVVFSEDAVFDTSTHFFLANWRDFFCPSRDDAIIQSNDQDWVLFYCHEDEWEYGRVALNQK